MVNKKQKADKERKEIVHEEKQEDKGHHTKTQQIHCELC